MSNARLYDLRRRNHHAVLEALREALRDADRDVDGVMITIATNNGRRARTLRAGSLADDPKAAIELFRTQLSLAIGD